MRGRARGRPSRRRAEQTAAGCGTVGAWRARAAVCAREGGLRAGAWVCDRHEIADYNRFKSWCDEYFHIPHRNEGRGVGGIFFDNIHGSSKQECFEFVNDCAHRFLDAYLPILERRKDLAYTVQQKEWQQIRRGRYVEFNLVYDRGTKFGLTTNGRIESILMSLPLTARWEYCHEVPIGTEEEKLLTVLKNPMDWLGA